MIRYIHHTLFGSCTNESISHFVFVHSSSESTALGSCLSLNFIWLVSDTLSNSPRLFSRLISHQELAAHFHPGLSSAVPTMLPLHHQNHSQKNNQHRSPDWAPLNPYFTENLLFLHDSSTCIYIHWHNLDAGLYPRTLLMENEDTEMKENRLTQPIIYPAPLLCQWTLAVEDLNCILLVYVLLLIGRSSITSLKLDL